MDGADSVEAAERAPVDQCGAHPDRLAESTCERCGTFVCGDCRSADLPSLCVECETRLGRARLVGHVPVLAIVMMVHGTLVAAMGLSLAVFGVAFVNNLAAAPGVGSPEEATVSWVLLGGLGLVGLTHVGVGALQVWAGWRARTFQSRGLALAALAAGLLTVVGCYCSLSSVPLLVWGLVVLLDGAVKTRFAASRASAR